MDNIIKKTIRDIKVELTEEFDKNFERKAFFSESWKPRKRKGKGSLLITTGKLRRSIRSKVDTNSITWTSSEPYASIHNEGGEIVVTSKMKKYFWAMYKKASNSITYSIKSRSAAKSSKNEKLSDEAEFYRAMALMKVGSKIKIPQRQYIGWSNDTHVIIERIFNSGLNQVETIIKNKLKPRR